MKALLVTLFLALGTFGYNQVVITTNPTDAICFGTCDGSITWAYSDVNLNSPYIVTLDDGSGSPIIQTFTSQTESGVFSGLCAGSYTVTVVNSINETHFNNVSISEPTQVLFSASTTAATSGNSDGEIVVSSSGGTPAYMFSIDNGVTYQASNIFSNLPAGSYDVMVIDANGCTSTSTVVVLMQTCVMAMGSGQITPPTCYGMCDGSIEINYTSDSQNLPFIFYATGPNGFNYTETLVNGAGLIELSNLCEGDYNYELFDANGCFTTLSVTLTGPTPLIVTLQNQVDPTTGNTDGSIEVSVSGGTGAYQYSIDNGITYQASPLFENLGDGLYIIYVQDANGCIQVLTVQLTDVQNCVLGLSTDQTIDVSCYGMCDGAAVMFYTSDSQNLPFVLEVTGPGGYFETSTLTNGVGFLTIPNLCAGTYQYTLTDANGCSVTETNTISSPAVLNLTTQNQVDPSIGNSDGSIEVATSGGTSPYQYSIDNGASYQSSPLFENLGDGLYIIEVVDANGCSYSYTILLTETQQCGLTLTTVQIFNPPCYGVCNGVVVIEYTSNTSMNIPFVLDITSTNGYSNSFTFTNQVGTQTIPSLCAGTYTYVLTDNAGCSVTMQNTLTSPPILNLNYVSQMDPTMGNSDGSFEVMATGGTPPYEYSIDNGANYQSSPIFTGLPDGTYVVEVQDANGCIAILTIALTETAICNVAMTTASVTGTSCYGSCNGEALVIYTSDSQNLPFVLEITGPGGYFETSTLTNGAGTLNIPNLCEGTYSYEITNSIGCVVTEINVITSPPQLVVSLSNQINPTIGNSDGSIEVQVSGGTPAYQYSIDNGITYQASPLFENLADGVYVIYVMDANGCVQVLTILLTETQNCDIDFWPNGRNPSCNDCDGEIYISFVDNSNDNNPYVLSIVGDNGFNYNYTYTIDMNWIPGAGFSTYGHLIDSLCVGEYILTLTSANGCTYVDTITLEINLLENDYILTDPTSGNSDGSIQFDITNGTTPWNYTFVLNGVAQNFSLFDNLPAGVYYAYIIDGDSCITDVDTLYLGTSLSLTEEKEILYQVYPNPTNDQLFITGFDDFQYEFISLEGKVLLKGFVTGNAELSLSIFPVGMYIINIKADDKFYQRKVVIQ